MSEKKSIEELRAIQETHEAKQRAKKEEEEEKAKARKIQEDKAGGEYYKREEFIAQARTADKDVEKMRAAQIEERMKRSEELKKGEEEKQIELQNMETQVGETRTYLEEIEALVAGKEEGEIAPEIKEELQKTQNDFQRIRKEKGELISHLQAIRAEQVSDEEVSKYRELQERIVKLNEDIQNIESNPVVMEWLVSEAKGEYQVRRQIFYEIHKLDNAQNLYQNRKQSKERSNFLEGVCQTFLDEEFEARGINNIQDRNERLKAMQKLIRSWNEKRHAGRRSRAINGRSNREGTRRRRAKESVRRFIA